jgi:Putative Flp pilus-assembly TadE/G-like
MLAVSRVRDGQRGTVMVMVALWLPLLALFTSFAIDAAHWWDYSRNLQNRADAAALAAGLAYGNTCATTSPDPGAMAKVGEAAQLYSGPGSGSDLVYPYGTPPADFAPTTYQNIPNLTRGNLDDYHVVINGSGPWQPGQTSNNNWPNHSGASASFTHGTVCSASYADDQNGASGPITDVWVTQDNVPLFFSLLGFRPTISAHARVELRQGIGGANVGPIAVRDEANPGCVTVNFVQDNPPTYTLLKTVTLTQQSATLWSNPTGDTLNMPATNVIVQPVLGCGASAVTYDGSTNSGLLYINSFSAATVNSGQAPALTTGGVSLGGSCNSDQYFSSQACTASVTAHVAFAPNVALSDQSVTATNTNTNRTVTLSRLSTQVNGNQNSVPAGGKLAVTSTAGFTSSGSIDVNGSSYAYSAVDATHFTLTGGGTGFRNNDVVTQTGDTSWSSGASGLQIGVQSGQNPIRIDWKQTGGSIGGNSCGNGANACTGSFGIQQQAFGACSACDPPDDSDGITSLQLRLATDPAGTYGENAFSSSASPNLVVSLTTSLLRFDTPSPTSPDIILRVGTSTDQATGLINCGQGSGANADSDAVTNGCPLANSAACPSTSQDYDFCAPFIDYDATKHPLGTCDPELRETADPTYSDCVETISGTRRAKIPLGIANRIINSQGVCSPNNWVAYANNPKTYPITADPRAVLFIITKPADLSKNSVVPIETFATFYITGWDTTGSIPNCNPPNGQPGNDPWPGQGKSKQNGAIWGHWITYSSDDIIPSNQFCDPTQFGVCATVLTR